MVETRILMVDDHNLFREGLSRLLESAPGFRVVGQCGSAAEAISALSNAPADVVLLDYDLGEKRGSSLVAELRKCQNQVKILMVTAGMSDAATLQTMEAGACGVFLKQNNPDQLVEAIRRVANDGIWLDSETVRSLVSAKSAQAEQAEHQRPLTSRQSDVMRGILDGLANKEIAWNLKVSESSIKAAIQELFHKAGVRTRSQLVRIAIERHSSDWLRPGTGD
jgi:two-component system nitrate/nitrite response regulator NarL